MRHAIEFLWGGSSCPILKGFLLSRFYIHPWNHLELSSILGGEGAGSQQAKVQTSVDLQRE